jgi:hypothetical protein
MNRGRWRLPSMGFVLLAAAWTLLVAFLAWGMSTPRLEQVWQIQQRMQQPGFAGLGQSEVQTLERSLDAHPELAQALIGGSEVAFVEPTRGGFMRLPRAHLLVKRGATRLRVWVECRAPGAAYPVRVTFDGGSLSRELSFERNERLSFDLCAADRSAPLLLRMRVDCAKPDPAAACRCELRVHAEAPSPAGKAP